MSPKMTRAEHIALLKDAIDANLKARVEHDSQRETRRTDLPAPKLHMYDPDPDWSRMRLENIIADPTRHALRKQLKMLGQKLFDLLGNTGALGDAAQEDRKREHYRSIIIDKAWDGVGNTTDRWWS
jgi:hypothetical protein